jgi:hypothetical protein
MARIHLSVVAPVVAWALFASEGLPAKESRALLTETRASLIARAQVWKPTDVATMDIKMGPAERELLLATVLASIRPRDSVVDRRSSPVRSGQVTR